MLTPHCSSAIFIFMRDLPTVTPAWSIKLLFMTVVVNSSSFTMIPFHGEREIFFKQESFPNTLISPLLHLLAPKGISSTRAQSVVGVTTTKLGMYFISMNPHCYGQVMIGMRARLIRIVRSVIGTMAGLLLGLEPILILVEMHFLIGRWIAGFHVEIVVRWKYVGITGHDHKGVKTVVSQNTDKLVTQRKGEVAA